MTQDASINALRRCIAGSSHSSLVSMDWKMNSLEVTNTLKELYGNVKTTTVRYKFIQQAIGK